MIIVEANIIRPQLKKLTATIKSGRLSCVAGNRVMPVATLKIPSPFPLISKSPKYFIQKHYY
jgi:hypothetical protein